MRNIPTPGQLYSNVQQAPSNSWNFAVGAIFLLFVGYITIKGELGQYIQLFLFQPVMPGGAGTPVNPNAASSPLNTVTGQQTPYSLSSASPAASAGVSTMGAAVGGWFGSALGLPGTIAGAGVGAAAGNEVANTAANIPNLLNPGNIPAYGWDALTSSGLVNPKTPQSPVPQGNGLGGLPATNTNPAWPGLGELPF
jgi:hypothetical protein